MPPVLFIATIQDSSSFERLYIISPSSLCNISIAPVRRAAEPFRSFWTSPIYSINSSSTLKSNSGCDSGACSPFTAISEPYVISGTPGIDSMVAIAIFKRVGGNIFDSAASAVNRRDLSESTCCITGSPCEDTPISISLSTVLNA